MIKQFFFLFHKFVIYFFINVFYVALWSRIVINCASKGLELYESVFGEMKSLPGHQSN